MGKKNFKNRKKARLQREFNKLYELGQKTGFREVQYERMCFLSSQIMKLNGESPFDVKKGWEDFKKNYLPIIKRLMEENEKTERCSNNEKQKKKL